MDMKDLFPANDKSFISRGAVQTGRHPGRESLEGPGRPWAPSGRREVRGTVRPKSSPPERERRPQGDRQVASDTRCQPTGCPPQGSAAMRCRGGGYVESRGEGAARGIRGSLAGSTRIEEDARRQPADSHGAASPPLAQGRGCAWPQRARPFDPLSRRLYRGGGRLLRGGAPQRWRAGNIGPYLSTRARS